MNKTFTDFRALSVQAYALLFGAIWGYTTFGSKITHVNGITPDVGLLFVWIIVGVAGLMLVGMKNRRIAEPKIRLRSIIADSLITLLVLVISNALPPYLGLMRSLVVLIVLGAYLIIYCSLLYSGKIVKQA